MGIVEFLEARIAEDEAVALKAGGAEAEWLYRDEFDRETGGEVVWANSRSEMERRGSLPSLVTYDRYVTMDHEGCLPAVDEDDGPHIARHDPARILREVAAKRRLVELYGSLSAQWAPNVDYGFAQTTLRTLAAIYSDHPDYNEEWRP